MTAMSSVETESILLGPNIIKIEGREYLEVAEKSRVIYDMANDESFIGTTYIHTLLFNHGGETFACQLEADKDTYTEHNIAELKKLCRSTVIDGNT
jgi:hypothetical protein